MGYHKAVLTELHRCTFTYSRNEPNFNSFASHGLKFAKLFETGIQPWSQFTSIQGQIQNNAEAGHVWKGCAYIA